MNFKFDILCKVECRHQYFDDAVFNGFTFAPSDDTQQLMKRYGLVFKIQAGSFFIGYDTFFAGARSLEDVLKINTVLSFRIDLLDLSLYNYTDNLPQNISDSIFHFRNFIIPDEPVTAAKSKKGETRLAEIDDPGGVTARQSLVQDTFAGESDVDGRAAFKEQYFSKPFGQVSILLHSGLEKEFVIKFASKATYWRYILLSDHLLQLQKPAIINKSTQRAFHGPVPVTMPENRQGIAFISEEPIMLTRMPNRMFYLVENYEPGNDRYKIIMAFLPNPEINLISHITTGEVEIVKKKYSNIII